MVPDELKQHIGKIDPPHVREVERGAIRRYADAVGNGNPLYFDEEYASESRYGTIIAPPGFFGWSMQSVPSSEGIIGLMTAMINAGYYRILDGGMSYEFFLPVRAGDIVIASPKVKDVNAKEGKSGTMMVCDFETTYLNQNGDLVAKAYQTLIGR
ncbi:MAG: MaoC family dehydratase N-terminal domain-containing protein [Dehalococcoidia bacterium]|jgi:acyl dehydratase|nr:MaoC family dehydratase N-terminal domain-containing protein [Dehalococcoidia bacterium]